MLYCTQLVLGISKNIFYLSWYLPQSKKKDFLRNILHMNHSILPGLSYSWYPKETWSFCTFARNLNHEKCSIDFYTTSLHFHAIAIGLSWRPYLCFPSQLFHRMETICFLFGGRTLILYWKTAAPSRGIFSSANRVWLEFSLSFDQGEVV